MPTPLTVLLYRHRSDIASVAGYNLRNAICAPATVLCASGFCGA
jgi:hypothetical protein